MEHEGENSNHNVTPLSALRLLAARAKRESVCDIGSQSVIPGQ